MKEVYYRLYLKDGRAVDFIDYEYMRSWWMAHSHTGLLDKVEVKDVSNLY